MASLCPVIWFIAEALKIYHRETSIIEQVGNTFENDDREECNTQIKRLIMWACNNLFCAVEVGETNILVDT